MKRLSLLALSAMAIVVTAGAAVSAASPAESPVAPTFSKDVAPIIYKSCVNCHRPGEIGPMSLISYDDVRPWSKSIREKVVKKEMPPWSADPAHSLKFRNDPTLSASDITTITSWVDAGSPRGNDAELPSVPKFAEGWKNGEPDMVLEMPVDYELPAEGELPIQDFFIKSPFKEDVLVEAVEIRPGNSAVVHHANAYVVTLPEGVELKNGRAYLNGKQLDRKDVEFGPGGSEGGAKLLSYVPGRGYERYGKGAGKRIPGGGKNTYINFYMHYTLDGKVEKDRTRVGLYFSKQQITHEIVNSLGFINATNFSVEGKELDNAVAPGSTGSGRNGLPNIPPYAENWKLVGVTPVTEPVTLYGLTPHLHLRGKSMQYLVTYPDGKELAALTVPKFDFNWQHYYDLAEPLKIPAGSKITVISTFDNSLKNAYNPAPEKEVYWSEQSWDEMYAPQIRAVIDNRVIGKGTQQQQQQPQQ